MIADIHSFTLARSLAEESMAEPRHRLMAGFEFWVRSASSCGLRQGGWLRCGLPMLQGPLGGEGGTSFGFLLASGN